MRKFGFVCGFLILVGCLSREPGLMVPKPIGTNLFDGKQGGVQILPVPSLEAFSICHGHTCRFVSVASFSSAQWETLRANLVIDINDAEHERTAIGLVIGLMEAMVGLQTGTSGDRAENLSQASGAGQMDCIDESSNTLTYLRLLEIGGLLNWHHVGARINRGLYTLVLQAPHSAAGLVESGSGDRYAVDSWFGANGEPALVMPYKLWAGGYRPPLSKLAVP